MGMWGLCKLSERVSDSSIAAVHTKQFGQAVETEIVLSDEQGNSGVC